MGPRLRVVVTAVWVVTIVATLIPPTTAAQVATSSESPPRTPWGVPDLQGIWSYATITPLQRPSALAGRAFLTDEEVADVSAYLKERTQKNRAAAIQELAWSLLTSAEFRFNH